MERVDCGHDDEETGGSNTTSHGPDVCSMGRTQIANEAETERELQEMEEPTSRQEQETASRLPKHLIRYLYTGHFLARWGVRMWEFSVGLYCISLWPNSLLFAAIYGVVESASTTLFGAVIGSWIDRLAYAKLGISQVLQYWLLTQNFSFLIAGGTVIELLIHSDLKSKNFAAFVSLVILVNFSGAVGILSTLAGTILIERDWVVVISEGNPPETLTQMNSVIRRIDLTCKLFAPVVSGFIISFASLKASAVTLACWNMVSLWLQYWLLVSVFRGIPALRESNQKRVVGTPSSNQEIAVSVSEERVICHSGICIMTEDSHWLRRNLEKILQSSFASSWRIYLEQETVLPGVALALLYFTVLSFGTLMTATLKWEGIAAYIIGIARGISATIGIAATLVYPILQSDISTLRTGLWSIWSQWALLGLCIASIWVHNKYVAAYMLMSGVAMSRLGLWMFDLSVMQLMQDTVAVSDRGTVGGVQNSLQSFMDLMANVMGIIISNPQDFWKLTMLSYAAVSLAAILYTSHTYRARKHLVHVEKLLVLVKWSTRSS